MAVGGEGFEFVVAAVMGWDGTGYVWAGVSRILGTDGLYRCRCRARWTESFLGWCLLKVCAWCVISV